LPDIPKYVRILTTFEFFSFLLYNRQEKKLTYLASCLYKKLPLTGLQGTCLVNDVVVTDRWWNTVDDRPL